MEAESLVDTLSRSLQKLKFKTLVCTLTDMLKEVGVETFGFTLRKKKANALVNTIANIKKEVDVETLSNTLIQVQAHQPTGLRTKTSTHLAKH